MAIFVRVVAAASLAATVALAATASATRRPRLVESRLAATVRRVVDGDTLDVATAHGAVRVRVLGIDTPELHRRPPDRLGPEAAATVRARLRPATAVTLVLPDTTCLGPAARSSCRDRYGRTLAYVEDARGDLGAALLAAGLARVYRKARCTRTARYEAIESQARAAHQGVWSR